MGEHVGQEGAGTLGEGATRLDEQKQGLNDRLQALLNELERDEDALRGAALAAYRDGQRELREGYAKLISWCNEHGVNLNLGQTKIDQIDADSQEEFRNAANESNLDRAI